MDRSSIFRGAGVGMDLLPSAPAPTNWPRGPRRNTLTGRMTSRALLPLAIPTLLALIGCARNAEERQLDAMREEIDSVRQSRDRADEPIGSREAPEPPAVIPQAYASASAVAPAPAVVQIGKDGDDASEDGAETSDPQDTTPRPMIRVLGGQRGSVRNGGRGEDHIEQTVADEGNAPPSASPRTSSLDPDAKRAYDAAISLVNSRHYDEALDALAAFLVKWPDHPYANNAMFWRGECYFVRGDYQRAADQFDGVIKRFPAGSKVPDALLKLGLSHQKLGNTAKAKECFDRLARQFAGTDAARHIPATRGAVVSAPGPAPEEPR
jgi:tol-pal system protein YbgF